MLECPEQCQITKPGGFKIDTKTNLLLNVNDLVEIFWNFYFFWNYNLLEKMLHIYGSLWVLIKPKCWVNYWDFRNTLHLKSLCFFPCKITDLATKVKNDVTLKRLKVETWNLDLRWSTYESFLVQIFGAIGCIIRVSEPKTEMPIAGLNSSSSKTNCTRGIKVSILEASGQAVSALKNKLWRFWHCFFLYLFIYTSEVHYGDKNSRNHQS